jgi:hypothetical protein
MQPFIGLLFQPWIIDDDDDDDDDDCGAVAAMNDGRGHRITRRKPAPQCRSVHHRSHMTCSGLEPESSRW